MSATCLWNVLASEALFNTTPHILAWVCRPYSLFLHPSSLIHTYIPPSPTQTFHSIYSIISLLCIFMYFISSYFLAPSRDYCIATGFHSIQLKLRLPPKVYETIVHCSRTESFNNISHKITKNSTQWTLWNISRNVLTMKTIKALLLWSECSMKIKSFFSY